MHTHSNLKSANELEVKILAEENDAICQLVRIGFTQPLAVFLERKYVTILQQQQKVHLFICQGCTVASDYFNIQSRVPKSEYFCSVDYERLIKKKVHAGDSGIKSEV